MNKTTTTDNLEPLWSQIERMKRGDMPKAACNPLAYGNSLNMSVEEMPRMSDKTVRLVMEALFAAYQLGQIRTHVLEEQEQARRNNA